MARLRDDLGTGALEVVETHISWVFIAERDVWKVKKPVALGFLDFSTPPRRRAACEAEVELNRRLAPQVYKGVVAVTRDAAGRHHIGGDGETVDWAVHMQRLPLEQRADHLLERGLLGAQELERVARCIADFHAHARCDEETSRFGTPEAIGFNVHENFEQTRATVRAHLGEQEAREIEAWQRSFLQRHRDVIHERIESGQVRDGHGDLRLEHVYLPPDGPVVVIDCIEFNERFRYADVCADVAFLSMDLAFHGRADLAERFLASYARAANDFDLFRVVDFYESYRAYVRGKVSSMLAADEQVDSSARANAAGRARRYYLLALAAERRPLVPPAVVAVGGIIASGKSTVAEQVSATMAAPTVDSDRTRKFLVGAAETRNVSTGTWTGAYAPTFTDRVYDEVLRRAGVVLASGRPVVIDASFRTQAMRDRARELARAHRVPFHFLECRADPETARGRLRERARRRGEVSDARLGIFDEFVASWEPPDELGPREHIVLDTTQPLDANVERLKRALPTWPWRLTG